MRETERMLNPGLNSLKVECYSENDENQAIGADLHLSATVRYPSHHVIPMVETDTSGFIFPLVNETLTRDYKRLRRSNTCIADPQRNIDIKHYYGSGSSNISRCSSTGSVNTLPKLHFRDHIKNYTDRYLAVEAVDEATAPMVEEGGGEREGADGVKLVQLLIACAEAVACRDKTHASFLLSDLRANALVYGSSFQRVASCFVQGLTDRLAMVQPIGAVGTGSPTMNIMDGATEKMHEALRLVYEICPYIQFGHFVANLSILEAFEGESFLHVIDLGMSLSLSHGYQWRGLIQSLANRSGQPLHRLRITGVGRCAEKLQIIGDELRTFAQEYGICLEFSVVKRSLDTLMPEDIKVYAGEVLVVNSIMQMHCVVKESRGALNSVLQMIHGLSPKLLILVEQDANHNGPFFLGRFMEALHYYSAIFDSLDAILPKYDTRRAKIEQFYYAEEIKNVVSCEGSARVERHERVDQWRRRMSRAGFQAVPIKMIAQVKQWLKKNSTFEGYNIMEEKGCLVLGWKPKPIIAASCWKR